jgi:hypothetical protein
VSNLSPSLEGLVCVGNNYTLSRIEVVVLSV